MIRKVTVTLLAGVICLLGATSALAAKYNEAPMLRVKVAAGELPPVEERLPEKPFVVGPGVLISEEDLDFEIGRYGGELRMVHNNPGWCPDTFMMNNEPLVSAPGLSVEGVRGNILESFEVSKDYKVFTFHMRKGLKWSDGYPVTTEDVLFAYEDVLLNEKLTPVFSTYLRSGTKPDGEPMKLEAIDDYTFRISFTKPYGGFLAQLAIVGWRGYTDLLKPKHYLKNFHPRYVPLKQLEPLIKEEKLAEGEWWTLFSMKDHTNWELASPTAIGFPVLYSWVMVEATPTTTRFERNPYYWKVDEEGNQLPYIDRTRLELVANVEMSNMKVITGEVDFLREGGSMIKISLYKENEKAGGFRTVLLDWHGGTGLFLNLTYPDPVWREIVRDVRFREALNMSINREEMIDVIRYGFAEPSTLVPSEYDPEKANQLLDEMGLDNRDAEGWRLRPDGKRLVISFEISSRHPHFVPSTELVVDYWKALGIEVTMKTIESSLRSIRVNANEVMATIEANHFPLWRVAGGFNDDYLRADWMSSWHVWYNTKGEKGEEPPAEVKRLYELSELGKVFIPYTQESEEVFDEIFSLLYENIFFFEMLEKVKQPLLVSARLGNIPYAGFSIAANYSGEEFFFRQ